MKKVTFTAYSNGIVNSSYDLIPTKRNGFYSVTDPFWIGIVSKNSVKATYWYSPEYSKESVEKFLNEIRKKAFHES
jgi:hypothetical protein